MAINLQETFRVHAPIDTVWRFMLDPHRVVTCMPGAQLQEVVDERTFLGTVKVKVGAITASYKGKVSFTEVDEGQHLVQMLAEGRDTGGGTAKGTVLGRLRSLPDGHTEIVAEASVDLTGRIMQVGRGMIQGVSHQLFQQFVHSTKAQLESEEAAGAAAAIGDGAPYAVAPAKNAPIRILPLLLRAIGASIARFFRKLFGRPTS
jgi:hypothetical protein